MLSFQLKKKKPTHFASAKKNKGKKEGKLSVKANDFCCEQQLKPSSLVLVLSAKLSVSLRKHVS